MECGKKKDRRCAQFLTSSYMNWRVRADLPTPPLPTMMTLCTIGCVVLAPLAAIFDWFCWPDDATGCCCCWCNLLQQRSIHVLSSLDGGCCCCCCCCWCWVDCDGQANVKILSPRSSDESSPLWQRRFCLTCWINWTKERRTELGHCLTVCQCSLTLIRISLQKTKTNPLRSALSFRLTHFISRTGRFLSPLLPPPSLFLRAPHVWRHLRVSASSYTLAHERTFFFSYFHNTATKTALYFFLFFKIITDKNSWIFKCPEQETKLYRYVKGSKGYL